MDQILAQYLNPAAILASVARASLTPGQLAPFFDTEGIPGLTAYINDPADDTPKPTAAIARGGPRMPIAAVEDVVKTLITTTYGWEKALYADSSLGRPEVLQQRIDKITAWLRKQADVQHEYLRLQAVLAASNVMGSRPAAVVIALSTDATKVQKEIFDKVVVLMEAALGGLTYSGIHLFTDNGFWSAWLGNKERRDTLIQSPQSGELRADPRVISDFGGVVWERYRGKGATQLPTNTAFAIPMGVSGLFRQVFSPDDTLQSIGQGEIGEPYYPNAWLLEDDKGYRLTMQTHPAMICTRPDCILEIHLS